MNATPRGTFRNANHARQLGRFDGMRWNNITPTDSDFVLDFQGRLFVYAEAKYGDTELPTGQRILLERQCNLMHQPPSRFAVAFVVSHWERGNDFYFKDTTVSLYLWNQKWRVPKKEQTLPQGIALFRQLAGLDERPVEEPPPVTTAADHSDWVAEYDEAVKQHWQGE